MENIERTVVRIQVWTLAFAAATFVTNVVGVAVAVVVAGARTLVRVRSPDVWGAHSESRRDELLGHTSCIFAEP